MSHYYEKMMVSKLKKISPIFFFIFIGGFILYQSSLLDLVVAKNVGGVIGPAAYPQLLGVLILILSLVFLLMTWYEKKEIPKDRPNTTSKPAYHRVFLSFIGLLILTYYLETLGFIIISVLLMMWFMFMMGERKWLFIALSSFLFSMIVYSTFRYGFNIVLPEGVLQIFG